MRLPSHLLAPSSQGRRPQAAHARAARWRQYFAAQPDQPGRKAGRGARRLTSWRCCQWPSRVPTPQLRSPEGRRRACCAVTPPGAEIAAAELGSGRAAPPTAPGALSGGGESVNAVDTFWAYYFVRFLMRFKRRMASRSVTRRTQAEQRTLLTYFTYCHAVNASSLRPRRPPPPDARTCHSHEHCHLTISQTRARDPLSKG